MSTHRAVRATRLVAAAAVAAVALASTSNHVQAAEPLDEGQIRAIRAYIARELDALDVPGAAVVIVHGDEIVFAEGFGVAQPDGTPVSPADPLLDLVRQQVDHVTRGDAADRGGAPRARRDRPATICRGSAPRIRTPPASRVRDLLAHTSGWSYDVGNVNRLDEADDDGALERNVRRLGETPLSRPSVGFGYSTANYDVLGLLVATVSGERYEDYMQRHVFDALAMHHTFANRTAAKRDGLASGYYPFLGVPTMGDTHSSARARRLRSSTRVPRISVTC